MNRELVIRPRADFELDELVEQIARRDERAAARFRDRVEETLRRIERFPELGPLLEIPEGPFRVRQVLRYPRFVIIYRLTDTLIDVARIVRG